ncbi:MAG: DNA photolyase family protein, partial [Candidatus Woesearchaeota archaeon]|nr:DNA photolyase family protein [Candidatus Woesearchaeota archaeon]
EASLDEVTYVKNPQLITHGGRKEGLKILSSLGRFAGYSEDRNYPSRELTTKLSPHNKFGTLSIRETYYEITRQLGEFSVLLNELYWRDFFTHIGYFFPHVFGHAFKNKYDNIKWKDDELKFKAWCEGKTGFPIVDAGMRELNSTGFMHNRVRMITASFLIKDLHIDWRKGEKYFATKLIDYDPCVNNGNWQWAASTGCDAQPYFRIFNPWLQQERYDYECRYIKRWLPELKDIGYKSIHNIKNEPVKGYVSPIIRHDIEKDIALEMYKI